MLPSDPFWSLHTHGDYSVGDAFGHVPAMVKKAVELDYPALGLTDHRNMSGAIQLYKHCRKAGIEPLPGIELDVHADTEYGERAGKMHLTVAAYSERGYRNLSRLATLSAQKFWYLPRIDFADLAQMAEDGATQGLVVGTGCLGGVLPQIFLRNGERAAEHMARTLAGWFPKVYVELQSHGIELKEYPGVTDEDVLQATWDIAQRVGLPVIVTRDSHYIEEADKAEHDALKELLAWSDDPEDAKFNGDGYHMVDAQGLRPYYPPKMLAAGLEGLTELANASYVRIRELENFKLQVPYVASGGDDPQGALERLLNERLTDEERADPETMQWVRSEVDVWRSSGMAAYALLCKQVADMMKEHEIRFATRGSASGSFVLYKFGVTQVHPIQMGLRFDRFLSRNRMKPPDVDFDVEHLRRGEVVAFLKSLYHVRPVGNLGKYSLHADDDGDGDHGKGSLKERYYMVLRKKGLKQPDWKDVPKADKDMLFRLSDRQIFKGYGKHAAGYIVAPNREILDHLPLARIASNPDLVTSYGKKDVEALGMVKLDLLGLKTQTAIKHMEATSGISIDDIPEDDGPTFRMISSGNTSGVFQLDGFAMTRGCQRLRPKSVEDIIAAQALFRPAPMQAGWTDDYMARRARREPVPVRHDDIMSVTKHTHGILLYQEQVMDVVNALGFDSIEMEAMLDAVKASNEYSIAAAEALRDMMPRIEQLARGRGWTQVDIDWLVAGLASYAEYSFNRAHASSYGRLAYRMAWMKKNRPIDFWCGILRAYEDSDATVVRKKTYQARTDGIGFLPAHVNMSGASYTIDRDRGKIRRGLISVSHVGLTTAERIASLAPFADLTDMGERLPTSIGGVKDLAVKRHPRDCAGVINYLYEADALEGMSHRP